MPKPTLFVCQSCHHSSEERPEHQTADGDRLLEQLNTLGAERSLFLPSFNSHSIEP
jgi:predicted metal-binding protein